MKTLLLYEKDSIIKNPKYQVLKDRGGEYYFRLCARNGEIILTGNPYQNKKYCLDAVNSLKLEGDFNFIEKEDRERKLYYFHLVQDNGSIIGSSEMYSTKIGRGNGIMSVMKIICDAPTEDITF